MPYFFSVLQDFNTICIIYSDLVTFFARLEAETRFRHRDWLKLAGEKIRREQVRTVPTFLSIRANFVLECVGTVIYHRSVQAKKILAGRRLKYSLKGGENS